MHSTGIVSLFCYSPDASACQTEGVFPSTDWAEMIRSFLAVVVNLAGGIVKKMMDFLLPFKLSWHHALPDFFLRKPNLVRACLLPLLLKWLRTVFKFVACL